MCKKENNNTENISVGLSSAAGSLLGTVSANAAINKFNSIEQPTKDDIIVQNAENSDNVAVISHSHDNDIQGNAIDEPAQDDTITDPIPAVTTPIIIVEPEPNTIVDIMYAGPTPEQNPIDPNIDPIICVYGPPEPDIINDTDDPANDFSADI